ncbi:MAG: hypothetical protein CMO98_00795 [Woeseia sp.]|nr:hypothetical protein [Woeseia sp.]|tara:strand:- start:298 stop:1131 length:834 start_codon:yes stop_codon:yes gene_type:complete
MSEKEEENASAEEIIRQVYAGIELNYFAEEWIAEVYWREGDLEEGDLFDCAVDNIGSVYTMWKHRSLADLAVDVRALNIQRNVLAAYVSRYIDLPKMHSKYLDWYAADTLMYAEFLPAITRLGNGLYGWNYLFPGQMSKTRMLLRTLWTLVKWGVWTFAAFFLAEELGLPAVGLFVLLTASIRFSMRKQKSKVPRLSVEMRAAYDVLDKDAFSWELLWGELQRTRELGAAWPSELYRLVEMRKNKVMLQSVSLHLSSPYEVEFKGYSTNHNSKRQDN